jgi:hypothetical protein
MSARTSYWIGTGIIALGAVLAWVGFMTRVWVTYVAVVVLVAGALYLLLARRRQLK